MKKRLVLGQAAIVLCALIAIVIISTIIKKSAGSGDKKLTPSDSSTANVEVSNVSISDEGSDSISVAAIDGTELTSEELEYFTNWIGTDYNYAFALSDYNSPTDMNVEQLTYCFNEGADELGLSDAELAKEYVAATGYSIETDITMYTDAALSSYLNKWAGISTSDLLYQEKPTSEKYGLYMVQHGDTNAVCFEAVSGEKNTDGTCHVVFTDINSSVKTNMYFAKNGDGYLVTSNHPEVCSYYDCNTNMNMSDFIFPHSECSYITKHDLESATEQDCKIARNEIFARYGLIFSSKELTEYFSQFSWYEPEYTSEMINHDTLSLVEKRNLKMIQEYEKEKGWRQ